MDDPETYAKRVLGLAGGIHTVNEYCEILTKNLTPLVFKVNIGILFQLMNQAVILTSSQAVEGESVIGVGVGKIHIASVVFTCYNMHLCM